MKIPRKVSTEDRERLGNHLDSYHTLNGVLMADVLTEGDLLILLSLEAGRGLVYRKIIVKKLIARLTTYLRAELMEEFQTLITNDQ